MVNIAINGYGRIGRNILRAFYERPALGEEIYFKTILDGYRDFGLDESELYNARDYTTFIGEDRDTAWM